ncbi:hypothetical protein BU23DRAFT_471817 [Bimuria novae-zelandiae CBS 107.79]|uniref:Rhodopsin domain-containing protein n=1 Tax=Bimuria novae-zelandiae CBS 107.79 TaxID=1447943 RepID=A0A6A5V542_9PLEO|nr:hypothetical protein BU23DRAFT_471817 [Bimuria novae-zelandiae CBS 107.79]
MVSQNLISLLVTSILFTSLAFFTVVARLYTRFRILKHAGVEEYLIIFSMAASSGFLVAVMFQIKYGLGTPFNTIKPNNLTKFYKALWAIIPLYNLALLFVKLSIVCQYMRIFKEVMFQRTCKILLGALAVYGCWTVFGSIFLCIPVQFFWGVGEGSCMNRLAFWFSNAGLNIATDILIFAIPIRSIVSLYMSKKKKIALGLVLGFGAFVCVTSIIRLKSLYTISVSPDTSLDGVQCAIWSGIEINVAIACSSISTLRPLMRKIFPRFLSLANRSDGYGPHSHSDNHNMKPLRKNTQEAAIQVCHSIQVNAENYNASREGSERGLIISTADCFSTNGPKPIRGDETV